MLMKTILTASAAFLLASCANNGVSIVEDQQTGLFASEEYGSDASTGPMVVVVRGSAFGYDPTTLANLVVNNMQGADWGPHAHFTPVSGPNTARMYFYVMAINGPLDLTGGSLCARPSQPIIPIALPAGEIHLEAALCRYNKNTTSVTGRASGVTGPADPKFRELIVSAVQDITRPNQQRIDSLDNDDSGGLHIHF
jgi:hypothetical protein